MPSIDGLQAQRELLLDIVAEAKRKLIKIDLALEQELDRMANYEKERQNKELPL